MKIAAKKSTDRRGVDVLITSERGETRHFQARSVTLQIVRGGMEVFQDFRGCYAWFKRCRLEARVDRERLVLGFATGVVSSRGAELSIVAASDAAGLSSEFSVNKPPVRTSKKNNQPESQKS